MPEGVGTPLEQYSGPSSAASINLEAHWLLLVNGKEAGRLSHSTFQRINSVQNLDMTIVTTRRLACQVIEGLSNLGIAGNKHGKLIQHTQEMADLGQAGRVGQVKDGAQLLRWR